MIRKALQHAFNALPFSFRYEVFYQSARALGIESYTVAGKSGPFVGPVSDQTIIRNYLEGGWLWGQQAELEIIDGFFRDRPGTLYDIGANIGIVTVPVAQRGVSVVAFEPDELNCALLRANVGRNCPGCDVTVLEKAVYRHAETLRFARASHNCGDGHLSDSGSYEISAIPLDSLPIPNPPFAIKLDTQGAEPAIFEGGQRTFEAAGMVLSEFWPAGMARMGNVPDAILETVRRAPHGRLVPHGCGPWMSGIELADQLHGICQAGDSPAHRNGIDFVIAQDQF